MHIIINKNFLTYNKYKAKCAIGKRGIGNKKKEGDKITPQGLFKIKFVLLTTMVGVKIWVFSNNNGYLWLPITVIKNSDYGFSI